MGRSPSFCFKMKACAGDSANNGDLSPPLPLPLPLPESKASPGKRRWSFGKRSTQNNVSSNIKTTVTMSIVNEKQNQQETSDNFEKAPSAPEKASIVEEIVQSPLPPSAVISSSVTEVVGQNIPEHDVIVIQTSIRKDLAQRELKRLINVVKLQAAARGYLVRRQAAGALRCIQAIIKMQVLVRAHLAVQSAELTMKKNSEDHMSANLVKECYKKLNKKESSTNNLICNAFARQLLKSTPKTKPIHISGDPLRPNSAWHWLERWMALTSEDQKKLFPNQDELRKVDEDNPAAYDVKVGVHVIHEKASSDLPFQDDDDLQSQVVENDKLAGKIGFQENPDNISGQMQFSSDANSHSELSGNSNIIEDLVVEKDNFMTRTAFLEISDNVSGKMPSLLDAGSHSKLAGDANKLDSAEDASEDGSRKELQENLEIGDKVLIESRKSRNPAFAAVQAKFEELSSASGLTNYFSHTSRDALSESKSVHTQAGSNFKEVSDMKSGYSKVDNELKEVGLNEKLASHNPKDPSENDAEISISSLHGSEVHIANIIPYVRDPDETKNGRISGENAALTLEAKGHSSELDAIQTEKMAESGKSSSIFTAAAKQSEMEQQPAESTSSTMMKSLPGIPVSKKQSQSEIKNSPVDSKNDSDARKSAEYSRKDKKNTKRQNSAGTAKVGHDDHEIKSSSTTSLPSYMQPTESAKAKVSPSVSQKSTPNLHDKDNHLKKRRSLPIADGKQGSSPQMKRSTSQAQHNSKGNGVYSPHNSGMSLKCGLHL